MLNEYTVILYSNVNDILSRSFTNDFFINSYYLLWTSSWYIPALIITIVNIFSIYHSKYAFKITWLLLNITALILLNSYQNINPCTYHVDTLGENFNALLSNSINKFHPALFYISLLTLFMSRTHTFSQSKRHYTVCVGNISSRYYSNNLLSLIITTLFLGSWWALQEGSWGGWWNWDPSEVFGLLVMLNYIYILHTSRGLECGTTSSYTWLVISLSTLIVYLFIQLNFDLVSHNFGTRVDQFIDTSQYFLSLILLVLLVLLSVYLKFFYHKSNKLTLLSSNKWSVKLNWFTTLALVLTFIIFSSFVLLLNDFFWKILRINILNTGNITCYYTSSLLTVLLVRVWSHTSYLYPTVLLFAFLTKDSLVLFTLAVYPYLHLFHTLLVTLLVIMLSETNQSVSFWELVSGGTTSIQASLLIDIFPHYLSLNNFFVENVTNSITNSRVVDNAWNFVWSSSSNESHSFTHPLTTDSTVQKLYSGTAISTYSISVLDTCVGSTTIVFALLLLALIILTVLNKKIIS